MKLLIKGHQQSPNDRQISPDSLSNWSCSSPFLLEVLSSIVSMLSFPSLGSLLQPLCVSPSSSVHTWPASLWLYPALFDISYFLYTVTPKRDFSMAHISGTPTTHVNAKHMEISNQMTQRPSHSTCLKKNYPFPPVISAPFLFQKKEFCFSLSWISQQPTSPLNSSFYNIQHLHPFTNNNVKKYFRNFPCNIFLSIPNNSAM